MNDCVPERSAVILKEQSIRGVAHRVLNRLRWVSLLSQKYEASFYPLVKLIRI